MKNTWRADPLIWGHGPRVFEVFLEPTCPFSVKAFGKLDDLLGQAGEDQITIKLRRQSQPWHMYSGVIVRYILAASTLESGKAAAKAVMAAVAAHREEFEFDHHCGGPNLDATPNDIIERIERYSGVKLATVPPLSPGAAVSRQVAGACEVNPPVRCIQFRAAPDLPIRIQDRFLNTLCELLKQCRARGLARVGVTALQQL